MNYIIKLKGKKEFIYINIFNSSKKFRNILEEYKKRNKIKIILLIYIYIEKFIVIESYINKESKKKPLKYNREVLILIIKSISKKIKKEATIKFKNNFNIKKEEKKLNINKKDIKIKGGNLFNIEKKRFIY